MATDRTSVVVQHLRRAALLNSEGDVYDGDLLEAFVNHRDETAFEAMVKRHGLMVLGVCRRILQDGHDAEDAFQAAFLVLARKAASIKPRHMLGNWLYGVAYRTALEARTVRSKRQARQVAMNSLPEPMARMTDLNHELRQALDAELNRLPDYYRAVVVLCDLEGRTQKEAAQQLGCPPGTVAGRLMRGRNLLARRLTRHGLEFSGGALAMALSGKAVAQGLPAPLVVSTVKAATTVAAGGAAASAISAQVAALAEGVMKTMLLNKLKTVALASLVATLLAAVPGMILFVAAGQPPTSEKAPVAALAGEKNDKPHAKPWVLDAGGFVFRTAWSRDGNTLATVGFAQDIEEQEIAGKKAKVTVTNSTVKLWDSAKRELKLSLGEEKKIRIESIALTADGKTAAIAAADFAPGRLDALEVRLLDTQTGATRRTIAHRGRVRAVAFSPDGKTLAIGGQYLPKLISGPYIRTVQLWDVDTGKMKHDFPQELKLRDPDTSGYLDGLRDLAFSPDGQLLASSDADGTIRLLDSQTGKLQHALEGHTEVVLAIAFSPDSKTLASASFDHSVRIWDVKTGKSLRTLTDNKGPVWSAAFSSDGKHLVAAGTIKGDAKGAGEIILWDTESWQAKRLFPGQKGASHPVAFSPTDSKSLAVGSVRLKDGKPIGAIELWRLDDLLADKTENAPATSSSADSDQPVAANQAQKDQALFGGGWRLVGFEAKGKEIPPNQVKAVDIRWAVKKDKITETARGKTRELTFRLDGAQKPRRIELTVVAGEGGDLFPGGTDNGQKLPGIYELKQDELTICFDAEGKDYPAEMTTKEDNLWVRYTLKRDKQAKDARTPEDKEPALDLEGELNVGRSNLRQIGLALAAYEADKGRLPAHAFYSKDGKPLLSWRVAILPYLLADDGDLLNQFKLDEPWDSAHNKQLLAKIPSFYASPGIKPKEPHATFIQIFAGKGTAFDGPEGKKAEDIKDLNNKLLVIEAGDAVPWTKPQDLPYDAAKPLPKLGGAFRTGFHFLIGFSNVHFTKKKGFEEDQLRREIEIDR